MTLYLIYNLIIVVFTIGTKVEKSLYFQIFTKYKEDARRGIIETWRTLNSSQYDEKDKKIYKTTLKDLIFNSLQGVKLENI